MASTSFGKLSYRFATDKLSHRISRLVRCLRQAQATLGRDSFDKLSHQQALQRKHPRVRKNGDGVHPKRPKRNDRKALPIEEQRLLARRMEYTLLPVINYSTDRGFGFGAYLVAARFAEGYDPYVWRMYLRLSATVKYNEEGQFIFPFHEDFLQIDLPGLWGGKLRLHGRVGFFRFSTTGYYGFGNASLRDEALPQKFYYYDRSYPEGMFHARIDLWRPKQKTASGRLSWFGGGAFLHNTIQILANTRLEQDLRIAQSGQSQIASFLREHLRGLREHVLLRLQTGLAWDDRNSEFVPTRGMFHEISLRMGTAFSRELLFVGTNVNARFFFPLWRDFLVLAMRFIFDLLVGEPPLYELYSYGGLFPEEGPGGGYSIRGTLPQRYYGKLKVIGNLELRAKIFRLHLWGLRLALGLVAFVDVGRVWGEFAYRTEELAQTVDGDAWGFKFGAGGGGRLQVGETVVMRADIAYSPTDRNLGFFFLLNHIF